MEQAYVLTTKTFNLLKEQVAIFPLKESLGFFQALSNLDSSKDTVALPKDLAEALFSYLSSKPYTAVAQVLNTVFSELSRDLKMVEKPTIENLVAQQGI
jgi:hypothetical protein